MPWAINSVSIVLKKDRSWDTNRVQVEMFDTGSEDNTVQLMFKADEDGIAGVKRLLSMMRQVEIERRKQQRRTT